MQDEPKPPVNRRAKYDWNALTTQFLMTDHSDFRAFLSDLGLPLSLMKSPNAKSIAEQKRRIMAAQTDRIRQAISAEPIREREERRLKVLKQLADNARALQQSVSNRIAADLVLTQRRPNQSLEEWVSELQNLRRNEAMLSPGELMALSVAQKHADELIRKAEGLEKFDWEQEERKQQATAKAQKLEFEIVQTSNGKPVEQLPWAPEEEKKSEAAG